MARPTPADDDELITVVIELTNGRYRILKSTLTRESGFFETLFKNDWQETTSGVVELTGDDDLALALVLQQLRNAETTAQFAQSINDVLTDSVTVGNHMNDFYLAMEMYMVADKYDMPALRIVLAQTTLPRLLKKLYYTPGLDTGGQSDFTRYLYEHYCDRLGEYPEELFDVYCHSVAHLRNEGHDVSQFIECIGQNPKFLKRLATCNGGDVSVPNGEDHIEHGDNKTKDEDGANTKNNDQDSGNVKDDKGGAYEDTAYDDG
ncbi:uncharacterized protein AB675_3359 [Cyphellophora attinorum]|uniref:BTB domain-containing protein n=1 Tax=Cyphellophora attinorum TaxID=1664694 RepID=A0A0N1HTE2_9EURO|nr:uncharacterized protein AB675_3359 [Phialophora attinorum]KPI39760.1 hypothetical protein AB675_3359 [Phialophora attinorum]